MSTLDDLRSTLEQHADGIDDTDRNIRPTAVRARIRTARRRRAGAVAMTAAAAVVIATGTTAVVRGSGDPEPAGPKLEDIRVPQRIEIHGFPYGLTETRRAAPDGTITLDKPDDGPVVVALVTTDLGSGQATLWAGLAPITRVRGDEHLSTPTDQAVGDLHVEFDDVPASARAQVAVYVPTGEPAPGETSDGVVFRQQIADRELVVAAFGKGGEDASADLPDVVGDLTVAAYCRSATPDLWLQRVGDSGGAPCEDMDPGSDPGAANQDSLLRPQPGDRTYGVFVTKGNGGPRATGVDVDFGVGIYRQAVAPRRLLGTEASTVIEADARTWRLDEVLDARGGEEYEVDTSQGAALIGIAHAGVREMSVSWAGAPEEGWSGIPPTAKPEGPGVLYPGIPLLADDHTVRVPVSGQHAQVRLLVYRPL